MNTQNECHDGRIKIYGTDFNGKPCRRRLIVLRKYEPKQPDEPEEERGAAFPQLREAEARFDRLLKALLIFRCSCALIRYNLADSQLSSLKNTRKGRTYI